MSFKIGDLVEHRGSPSVVWEITNITGITSSRPWASVRIFAQSQINKSWCGKGKTTFYLDEFDSANPLLVIALAAQGQERI